MEKLLKSVTPKQAKSYKKEFYPEPCIHIIELIAQVYKNDEETRCMTKQV
jgi:hypothetical protein